MEYDRNKIRENAGKKFELAKKTTGPNPATAIERGGNKNGVEKKKTAAEFEHEKKVAARERAIEQEKTNQEKRERVLHSLDRATEFIRNALQNNLVSSVDRARYEWVLQSVDDARKASNTQFKDVVKREATAANGVKVSRVEGVPLDGLMQLVDKARYDLQFQSEATTDAAAAKQAQLEISLRENISEEKLIWYSVFGKLKEDSALREEVEALVAKDQERRGFGYPPEERRMQLGEALRQRAEHYALHPQFAKKSELEDLKKISDNLAEGAAPYFSYHYHRMSVSDLTRSERRDQYPYTRQEAQNIAQYPEYREALLKRLQSELPKDFKKLSAYEQNYRLAKFALRDRVVLNLPQEQAIPAEPTIEPTIEPTTEPAPATPEPQVTPTPTVGGVVRRTETANPPVTETQTAKLKNTEPLYDWENKIEFTPKAKLTNTNPLYDIENDAFGEKKGRDLPPKIDVKAKLVDISEIAKRMAWTKAEEKLRGEFEKSGWFKKNIWKGLSENYYRIKYFEEAKKEIQQDNDLLKAIEGRLSGGRGTGTANKKDYYAILDSVVTQYENDLVEAERELGEKVTGNPQLSLKVAELMYRHQQNKWSDLKDFGGMTGRDAVELYVKKEIAPMLKNAAWATDAQGNKTREGEAKGLLYSNNLWAIAEGNKDFINHQIEKAIQQFGPENKAAIIAQLQGVMNVEMQLGLRERDLQNNRPKGILSLYERLLDKTENNRFLGKIVTNPFVMGVVGGVLGGKIGRAAGKTLVAAGLVGTGIATSFAAPLVAGAGIGAYMAYRKRSKDIKYDIAQEQRFETLGGVSHELLDRVGRFDTMKFDDALTIMHSLENKNNLSDAEKQMMAQVVARLQMGQTQTPKQGFFGKYQGKDNIDLFILGEEEGKKYGTVEVAMTQLKLAIKKIYGKTGLTEAQLEQFTLPVREALIKDIDAKNKDMNKFRRWEAFKSGAKGAIFGVAGGLIAQEALNWAGHGTGVAVEKMGLGSGMANYFRGHGTTLEKLMHWNQSHNLAQHPWENPSGGNMQHILEHHKVLEHQPGMSLQDLKNKFGVVKISHHDWHHDHPAGETPGHHIYTGKELQGQIHLNKGSDAVTISAKGMLDNIKGNIENWGQPGSVVGKNWDGTVDSRFGHLLEGVVRKLDLNNMTDEEIQQQLRDYAGQMHEHLVVRLIPTEAMNHAHEGIVVGHVDSHGNIQLPDNIRQTFFDKDGHQLAKYMEVGYVNEHGQFDTLATSVAKGDGFFPAPGGSDVLVDKVVDRVVATKEDDWMTPLMMPQRKIYGREKEKPKEKKVKKVETTEHGHGNGTGVETGHQTGPEHIAREKELREQNKDYFNREKVLGMAGVYQRSLSKEKRAEAGVDMELIQAWWDIEEEVQNKAKQEAEKKKKEAAAQQAKAAKNGHGHGAHGGHAEQHPAPAAPELILHEEGPSTEEYIAEVRKLEIVVKAVENYFAGVADLDKHIRAVKEKKLTRFTDNLETLMEQFEIATGEEWDSSFKPDAYRKKREEELEPKKKQKPKGDGKEKDKKKEDEEPEENNDADDEKDVEQEIKERQNNDLKKALAEFKENHKNIKLVIDKDWKDDPVAQEKAVKVLEKTLGTLNSLYRKKAKEFKPGSITIILAKEGAPDIKEDTWKIPKGMKAIGLEKLLSKKTGAKDAENSKKKG